MCRCSTSTVATAFLSASDGLTSSALIDVWPSHVAALGCAGASDLPVFGESCPRLAVVASFEERSPRTESILLELVFWEPHFFVFKISSAIA